MSADAFYGDLSKEIDFVNPESGQEVQKVSRTTLLCLPQEGDMLWKSSSRLMSQANINGLSICDWALNKKAILSCLPLCSCAHSHLSLQDKVLRMMYVWALCRDQEELNPYAAWRLLDISASSTEQIL